MKTVIRTLIALATLGAVVAVALVGLGLYNVSARVGHLPGVSWVLHTTFEQSVRLRAPSKGEIPDDLSDPDRIRLGALHFKAACAFCHAVPGQPRSATARSMNPPPPPISEAVTEWGPQHLFWIVREGVKMSGMPHWPAANRPGEIWSMVAYLSAVDNMTAADQRGLAGSREPAVNCAQCHGENGQPDNAYIPRLDILTRDQIATALEQYRLGSRPSGFMSEAASTLSDEDIVALAREFGAETVPEGVIPDGQRDTLAAELALRGTGDVPACVACHGPGRTEAEAIAPSLAGQAEAYMVEQLKLWRDGYRRGGIRGALMRKAAQDLSNEDIALLAAWFAGLETGAAN